MQVEGPGAADVRIAGRQPDRPGDRVEVHQVVGPVSERRCQVLRAAPPGSITPEPSAAETAASNAEVAWLDAFSIARQTIAPAIGAPDGSSTRPKAPSKVH